MNQPEELIAALRPVVAAMNQLGVRHYVSVGVSDLLQRLLNEIDQ